MGGTVERIVVFLCSLQAKRSILRLFWSFQEHLDVTDELGIVSSFMFNKLPKVLSSIACNEANEIVVTVSSDGVPLYKSSKSQLILLTMNVVGVANLPQIPIGVYHGVKKPSVMKPFSVLFYSGDAAQRAWIAGVKGHTAKNGCHMCDQVGKKIGTRLVFSTKRGNPRTDVNFAMRECTDHHQPEFLNEPTPLKEIGTGMVTQIPLDPMHLIDRGVCSNKVYFITKQFSFNPIQNCIFANASK